MPSKALRWHPRCSQIAVDPLDARGTMRAQGRLGYVFCYCHQELPTIRAVLFRPSLPTASQRLPQDHFHPKFAVLPYIFEWMAADSCS